MALVVFSFSSTLLPAISPGKPAWLYWLVGTVGAIFFFASVLLHEISHALTARLNNLPVAKITLFLFGGVSNLNREPASAEIEFKIAIVGPFSSFIIGALLIGASNLLARILGANLLWLMIGEVGFINFYLAVFNLLPGFPLDGGRILRSIIWWRSGDLSKATRWASFTGRIMAIAIIIFGFTSFIVLGSLGGIWLALIGYFIYRAAGISSKIDQTAKND